MAIKSSRKKDGYAAWLLTKMFDELTGNYFGNAVAEDRGKTFISESDHISDRNIPCIEESDRSNGPGFNSRAIL
jgi:hypothetical protein